MSACIDCGADLVDSALYEGEGENLDSFEALFVGPVSVAFEIKTLLDNQGYSVYLQGAGEGGEIEADLGDDSALVRILVPIDSVDAALELIEGYAPEGRKEPDDAAVSLGEETAFWDADFCADDAIEAGDEDLADPGVLGAKSDLPEQAGSGNCVVEDAALPGKRGSGAAANGARSVKSSRKKGPTARAGKGKAMNSSKKATKRKTRRVKK
ncbi:MAG: hypothetical protein ACYTFG_02095 [Planctomycetota bacterium]